ncbi:MAG: hypothetical protein QM368_02950 [Bacillota bacterium]|nr:hypothetical protein [Bacillota bacterium]HHU30287.1 hypothetical protein [Bacillota bacterium]
MKRFLAVLLVGVTLGAALMNLLLSKRYDELFISREKLKVELYETRERLKKLEVQEKQAALLVQDIEVLFPEDKNDPLVEVKLQAAVLELTESLLGEDVESVSYQLLTDLLDSRLLEIEGKYYRVKVKTMVIARIITFILDYSPVAKPGEGEF